MSTEMDAFAETVLGFVRTPSQPFKPSVYHNIEGDCVEFIASDEPFYAERIDSLVTVYYGQESKKIVGSLIKGAKKLEELLRKTPGLKIEISDGKMRLEHFFACQQLNAGDPIIAITYKKLRQLAEETEAEFELCKNS